MASAANHSMPNILKRVLGFPRLLVPARFRAGIPVVRLSGVIGVATPLRQFKCEP